MEEIENAFYDLRAVNPNIAPKQELK